MKVLQVEDDRAVAAGVAAILSDHGLQVVSVHSVAEALARVATDACDLVLLDLGLPDGDGLRVLRAVRRERPGLPVLVLSARDCLESRLRALDSGADDYLGKPFALAELVSRVRAIARRAYGVQDDALRIGGLCVDLAQRRVSVRGCPVTLTACEFELLALLMKRAGRVVTRRVLEEQSLPGGQVLASTSLGMHMANLRRKLGDAYIRTVRGVGYAIDGCLAMES